MSAMLFAALTVAAFAGHWPQFGGDAGRSGHQPVDPTGPPIVKEYAKLTDKPVVTSVINSAGSDRLMIYGTEGTVGGDDGNVHLQYLSDGEPVGPEAGVDIEDGANDIDTFRGSNGAVPTPAITAGASVTPVETSTASGLGYVVAVHNDNNQDGSATNIVTGQTDPRTGNDIAIAFIDEETGVKTIDKSVGGNVQNTTDSGYDPSKPNTVNYTISSSPLLTAPDGDGARDLYFVAARATSTADQTSFPCAPGQPFDSPPPGAPATRGCQVTARTTLFKVHISDADVDPNFAPEDISWVTVPSTNTLASPTLVNLDGEPHITVSGNDGNLRVYKAADIDATDPATPAPAYTVDAGEGNVMTPSVPVTASGTVPNLAPAIFVASDNETTDDSSTVHRITRDPSDATKLIVAQSSPALAGLPAPALAVSAFAASDGSGFTGGRVVFTTSQNIYSLDPSNLSRGTFFDIGSSLAGGTTGFQYTTAAVSGGVAFVQRDNGEHLALDQVTLNPVGFDAYGDPDNPPAAGVGIGQPSITQRFVQFGNRNGAFVYRAAPYVPIPGSVGISVSDVSINEGDSGTRTATFTLTKTGTAAGSVRVQTADGTAKAGEDYVALGQTTVEFEAGETEQTVDVTINGDTTFESDEFFKLLLTTPSAGVIVTDTEGSGIILNDDANPGGDGGGGGGGNAAVLIVSDAVATESDTATVNLAFTVSLTSAAAQAVTVRYGTVDRTATAGVDYTAASGALTFAPGELTKTVNVAVRPDTSREEAEQLVLGLANATGAAIADANGTGIIIDDDAPPAQPFAQAPSISLKVTPKRDRTKPYRFTSTGTLSVPSGVARGKACQGRVEVQVKVIRKTISTRRANINSSCRYRMTVSFKDAKRFSRSGVVSFRARYLGTPFLKAARSKEIKTRTTR